MSDHKLSEELWHEKLYFRTYDPHHQEMSDVLIVLGSVV